MTQISIGRLQVEHLQEALGIGVEQPRLSWLIQTETKGWYQKGYEIEIYDADGKLTEQTGYIESDQSILVAWPFAPLSSCQRVSVRVRVWGADEQVSDWSESASIEAGLLHSEDWHAQFIAPDWDEDTIKSNPAPYLRRAFELRAGITSARLYISSLGLYEAELNGQVVGNQVFSPGWTVYDEHLRYQTFDVTEMVNEGNNVIGATLGDGWFRGRIGFGGGQRNIYGEQLALLAQLEVHYTDGSWERIVTDENWRAATGPILMNSIYDGETYDARLEQAGWSSPGFDDSAWNGVRTIEWNMNALKAPLGPPVRRVGTVNPVSVHTSPSGKTIVDFGQNLVGWLSIRLKGPAGHMVTLRHAEVLEEGELGTRPLRFADATDHYTLKGGDLETWEPRFTFHGFRYVEVNNWPGEFSVDDVTAVIIHSDMERIGWFECSDPLLNRLHENVVWGMRGNFLDVPTDCPQRDERLGWTGDLQVFSPTASFLYDVTGFLQSWLKDLAIEQCKAGGMVPQVVPMVLDRPMPGAAWSDAATIVPWVLYQRFGDVQIIADQYESMKAWTDYVIEAAGDNHLWDTGFQFGDWLDPTAPPHNPGQARTNKAIVASAYYVRSAELVAQAAALLGHHNDHEYYCQVAEQARVAFAQEYITPAGRLMNDAETAYALALTFNLFSNAEQAQHAGDRLAELVRESGYHIRTGFVGTPLICDALCSTGHYATAYRLLLQQECPSWLYPVTMGATTIWERWDSMLPDGSINSGEMTSFNHYALGAVADWMHRTIGGLAPIEPGYRHLSISPKPGGGLTQATVRHRTPYGMVKSAWKIEDGTFNLSVLIPPNTTAFVSLPGDKSDPIEVGSGSWQWAVPYQDPYARGSYTVDDLIGDISYDPTARKTLMDILQQIEAPGFLMGMLLHERNLPLREALMMLSNHEEAVVLMNQAFAAINQP
ncbi:MAG: family 78 glycoside hydrolase catalytic domain [Ardenticatenaceae bacterium]|nr:family 78 glycoside hydrolase catalytic domain [Ardenticatenaceae bacterium]MCB8946468.1 family 78 glycoside hydrolase catalytic domain [Ardenticatenaceae bacterium]